MLLLADGGLELTAEQVSAATAHGHHVLLVGNAGPGRVSGCRLSRLHRDALAEALKQSGLDYQDAWRVAGEVAGSGVALKRVLLGYSCTPDWAKGPIAADLAPVVLFGAWDAGSDADCERIAGVFGKPYKEVERLLVSWDKVNDPLVRRVEQNWRVVSREDAWRWLAPHLTPEHYTRFRQAAVEVLTELNPRYDLPADQRLYASIHKAVSRHSARLRRAMAEILCLLSLRPPEAEGSARPVDVARAIIAEVFAKADDWRLWASFDYALVFIAEAAPSLFLKAVKDDLRGESPATVELFRQGGQGVFSEFPHVGLMWALEGLMWEREWVTDAVLVLGRLAALDPGGNHHPRPAGVLREAFLPWYPQCCLNVGDRCRALDRLQQAEPVVAWQLFLGLLPKTLDSSSPRHRPTYRKISPTKEDGVTGDEYWQQVTHVAQRLAEAAGTDTERWQQLLEELHSLPDEILATVLVQVQVLATTLDENKRTCLWETLRKEANQHRFFVTARWAMPDHRIKKIERLARGLEPTDPVVRNAWLFRVRDSFPSGTTAETPHEQRERLRDDARLAALREISAAGGLEAVHRLVERLNEHECGTAGFMLAKHTILPADAEVLPNWLEEDNPAVNAFACGYAHGRFATNGWGWLNQIGAGRWSPKTFGTLSRIFAFGDRTWQEVAALGAEYADAYWQTVSPWMHGSTPAEAERAVHELLSRGRALAALECVNSCADNKVPITADMLVSVIERVRGRFLEQAGTEGGAQPKLDFYDVARALEAVQEQESLTPEQTERAERLEWDFLPILKHHGSPRLLLNHLCRDPAQFVELLSIAAFQRDDPQSDDPAEVAEPAKNMVQNCHDLLDSLHRLPGTCEDGHLDEAAFRKWVEEARENASARGYRKACEQVVGKWLLHSPVDATGYWPCAAVCRLLTDDGSEHMMRAFEMSIFNNQGWPGPLGHGRVMSSLAERREAMERLREFAAKLDLDFPMVAAVLRQAAEDQRQVLNRLSRDED